MMWRTARLVVGLLILSLGVSSGIASAQYNAPPQQAPPSTAPASPSTAPAAAPANNTAPTAAPASGRYMINKRWAIVNGVSEEVLTDSHGMTLYYFAPDSATAATCTGACGKIWPGAMAPFHWSTSPALPGLVGTIETAHGPQLTYNGHPLYRYAKDAAPGQAAGEGVAGKWHVATPGVGLLQ